MHDQRLAGKDLQSRRRIKIAARPLPVRRRAADHLVVEKEKVLDRRCYRIERGPTLPRGEPHFEDAFLARQRHRLSELGRTARSVLLSAGCAPAVAVKHSSSTTSARAPNARKLNSRPASNASRNESLCMKRILCPQRARCSMYSMKATPNPQLRSY